MKRSCAVLRVPGMRDMPVPAESAEQRRLFTWARAETRRIPELKLLYAVPNGGSRHALEAKNLKAEGVKAGVPDIHMPVKRSHNSLYIELKRSAFALPETGLAKWGAVSEDQLAWLESLQRAGNYAVICRGCDHARDTILAYLANDSKRLERLNDWWVALSAEKLSKITKSKKVGRAVRASQPTRRRSDG